MKLKSILAAVVAGVALASPLAAKAYEYNDGTYKWGFYTYENADKVQVANLTSVCRVDGQKISGAIAFPATVSATVTNELGYSKKDEATDKYNWQSTRAPKIETLTLPVEEISCTAFTYEEDGEGPMTQNDPLVTSVTIPEGVKDVYGFNFACLTNVTEVTFPSTVKSITSCFLFCDKLASVSIPENAYVDCAFVGTPWAKAMGDFFVWNGNLIRYQGTATEVVVPEGVAVINDLAFTPNYYTGFTKEQDEMFASAANITSVLLPSSLEEIGYQAFSCCEKLAAINIPNGVYSIRDAAFEYTALTAITLPKSIRELRSYVFAYTPISSLVIPDGPQWFEGACAEMTNLTSVTVPATAKFFMYTFMGCEKLTAVDIPASVEDVQPNSFAGCTSLTSVTGGAGLKAVASNAFGDEDVHWDWEKDEYVNNGTGVPFYDNAPDGFRVLGPVAYGYKGDLPENLTVPAGVKYVMGELIPDFVDKSAAKTLTLSEGVETVGGHAFTNCGNLETVNLGNTVTNLESHAFVGCHTLSNVTGGAALEIGCEAFIGTKLWWDTADLAGNDEPFGLIRLGKSVVFGYKGKFAAGEFNIPADVTDFGLCGFDDSIANVTDLTGGASLKGSLTLSYFGKLQRVDVEGAIDGFDCRGLKELADVNLPNVKLWGIGGGQFGFCTNLVNVAVGLDPESVSLGLASISGDAFLGCDKLQSVNIRCSGCKLKGYEVEFNTGKETFAADDVQVFKYIGQRTDFATNSWNWSSTGWSSFSIIPQFVKVVVDESALEPFDKDVKSDYVGMLYDADYKLVGTFEVAVKKATKAKDATATVKITPLNGKKETIKDTIDANGNGQGALTGLVFGANGVTGTFTAPKNNATFKLEGASDASKSTDKADKEYLKGLKDKTWGVVLEPVGKVQSDLANGYIALSVTMNNTGKAKVAGVLPDGNKVSVSTKIIVGTDACAIPVVFSKSGESLGFTLWTDREGNATDVTDVSDWAGKVQKVTFVQGEQAFDWGDARELLSVPVFRIVDDLPDALANSIVDFLPEEVEFSFKKGNAAMWDFAKAPSIKAKKGEIDWAKIAADVEKGKTNFSGLKLKVNKKTGVITGSFTLYSFNNKNALKKTKVTVNGVMVDGVGYGVGFVKKTGACFVKIGEWIEEE